MYLCPQTLISIVINILSRMIEQDIITGVRFMGAASMILIALVVALVNRGNVRSAVYERSRWFIFTASILLGVHNLIQFFGHFREENFTLCWAINLAFYVVITPFYNIGELNILRAGRNMTKRYWNNSIFMIICYIIFGIGILTDTIINDEAPWLTATFAVAVCYFLKVLELSRTLIRDMKVVGTRLTDEELEDRHRALHYTAKSMKWVIIFSLLTPWVGMSSSLTLNSIFGLIMLGMLVWFIIQFVLYGNNIAEMIGVTDEITEAVMIEEEAHSKTADHNDKSNTAQHRIELWVAARHYTNPNVTITSALEAMDISATALNLYLEQNTTVANYRQWLPHLRIEEAKRVMLEHPEYTLDAVAEACGYANKSNLSRSFKAHEGITPAAWCHAEGVRTDS